MKDESWRDFFIRSLRELEDLNYIETVNDKEVLDKPVWYLSYFVTLQSKKCIICNGKAEFKGVCINHFIETGPNLLNSL